MLTEITLENFRCFHEQQTARLAPLTILVGENSTGKTSFLALIRILAELSTATALPNFKSPPFDLGSFEEIVHRHKNRLEEGAEFRGGLKAILQEPRLSASKWSKMQLDVTFASQGTTPFPVQRAAKIDDVRFVEHRPRDGEHTVLLSTSRGSWCITLSREEDPHSDFLNALWSPAMFIFLAGREITGEDKEWFKPIDGSPSITSEDLLSLAAFGMMSARISVPFASAPIRSAPNRTYDPALPTRDPGGDGLPMFLAELSSSQNGQQWEFLKSKIEGFGQRSGLFDEIRIRRLGRNISSPFQVEFRKGSKKGPFRNQVDIGYGVSQVLPVITELLRNDAPNFSLWQQPEVHLHPRAQAALATFFCGLAAEGKQLIVETHGDYLLDRVRMDVRDGKAGLKPEDVSILYFERTGLDVQIHSIRFDAQGNVLDVPPGYRQFFLEEVNRSLGI